MREIFCALLVPVGQVESFWVSHVENAGVILMKYKGIPSFIIIFRTTLKYYLPDGFIFDKSGTSLFGDCESKE